VNSKTIFLHKSGKLQNCFITEANMKKFILMMEDLWVAAAFAEAGT